MDAVCSLPLEAQLRFAMLYAFLLTLSLSGCRDAGMATLPQDPNGSGFTQDWPGPKNPQQIIRGHIHGAGDQHIAQAQIVAIRVLSQQPLGPSVQSDETGVFHYVVTEPLDNAEIILFRGQKGNLTYFTLATAADMRVAAHHNLGVTLDFPSSIVAKAIVPKLAEAIVSLSGRPESQHRLKVLMQEYHALGATVTNLLGIASRDERLNRAFADMTEQPEDSKLNTLAATFIEFSDARQSFVRLVDSINQSVVANIQEGGKLITPRHWAIGETTEVKPPQRMFNGNQATIMYEGGVVNVNIDSGMFLEGALADSVLKQLNLGLDTAIQHAGGNHDAGVVRGNHWADVYAAVDAVRGGHASDGALANGELQAVNVGIGLTSGPHASDGSWVNIEMPYVAVGMTVTKGTHLSDGSWVNNDGNNINTSMTVTKGTHLSDGSWVNNDGTNVNSSMTVTKGTHLSDGSWVNNDGTNVNSSVNAVKGTHLSDGSWVNNDGNNVNTSVNATKGTHASDNSWVNNDGTNVNSSVSVTKSTHASDGQITNN